MTSTPAEFRRAVGLALGDALIETVDGFDVSADGARLHFAISDGPVHRIGALQLATLQVEISVLAGDQRAAEKLLQRIDRATQRGGG